MIKGRNSKFKENLIDFLLDGLDHHLEKAFFRILKFFIFACFRVENETRFALEIFHKGLEELSLVQAYVMFVLRRLGHEFQVLKTGLCRSSDEIFCDRLEFLPFELKGDDFEEHFEACGLGFEDIRLDVLGEEESIERQE